MREHRERDRECKSLLDHRPDASRVAPQGIKRLRRQEQGLVQQLQPWDDHGLDDDGQ